MGSDTPSIGFLTPSVEIWFFVPTACTASLFGCTEQLSATLAAFLSLTTHACHWRCGVATIFGVLGRQAGLIVCWAEEGPCQHVAAVSETCVF